MRLITKLLMKILIAPSLALFLSACSPAEFVDLSADEKYKAFIGQTLLVPEKGIAIGITTDANYRKQVDYVLLTHPPGISGPEVIFRKATPENFKLKIIGVLSVDHIFYKTYFFNVEPIECNDFGKMIVMQIPEKQMKNVIKRWGLDNNR